VSDQADEFAKLRDALFRLAPEAAGPDAALDRVRHRVRLRRGGALAGGVALLTLLGLVSAYGLSLRSSSGPSFTNRVAATHSRAGAGAPLSSSSAVTNSWLPACNLPAPVAGFNADSDAGVIDRVRGSSPTALPAHLATASGVSLAKVRVMVMRSHASVYAPPPSPQSGSSQGPVPWTSTATWHVESFGPAMTDGRTLTAHLGDNGDDGTAIPAGTYEVYFSALETGTNSCGQQITQLVTTRLGYVTIQAS